MDTHSSKCPPTLDRDLNLKQSRVNSLYVHLKAKNFFPLPFPLKQTKKTTKIILKAFKNVQQITVCMSPTSARFTDENTDTKTV